MAQRYVRVKTAQGQIYYGLLQTNRRVKVLDGPPWLGSKVIDLELENNSYQLLAPCVPSKIIAVGKNYTNHAAEMGGVVPQEPLLFFKPPTAIIAHQENIHYPPQTKHLDYEGELALIIGEKAKDCSVKEANHKIWGYTIANDITARDLQKQDSQWTRAKGFDTFCPLGPWIVRELSPEALLQTFINTETEPRQSATIQTMVFSPEQIVSYISQVMTLLPGDVILTGTPEGVGPLQPADQVRVAIEGIGTLENSVVIATRVSSELENKQLLK